LHVQFRLFNEFEKPYIQIPDQKINTFQALTNHLEEEFSQKQYHYKMQLYHYFQLLLLNIERIKAGQQPKVEHDPHFELAVRFKRALEDHKKDFKNVAFFSELLGVSEKTLSNISKKYFKDTPSQVIHHSRVLEAQRLLSNSNLSIKEVAYQLGFDQPTYFTKYFKKYTKLTPKDFIQQVR